jgi:hypothetical protein
MLRAIAIGALIIIGLCRAADAADCTTEHAAEAADRLPIDYRLIGMMLPEDLKSDDPVPIWEHLKLAVQFAAWAREYKENPDWECRRLLVHIWLGTLINRDDDLGLDQFGMGVPDSVRDLARNY